MKKFNKILELRKINNLDGEVKDLLSFLIKHIESQEKINQDLCVEIQLLRKRAESFEKGEGKWLFIFKKIRDFLCKVEENLKVSS